MTQCLHDPEALRVHSLEEMLRQRLFGILAGYEDCNDHTLKMRNAITIA